MKLILASGSPRRSEILKNAGYEFVVKPTSADESLPGGILPEDAVKLLSERKADAAKIECSDVVLSADTVVALGDRILGKPSDKAEAFSMLRSLSGKTHSVYTGVTIKSAEKKRVFAVKTDVLFYPLTDDEINAYIATGEPFDKAGAYGIQGRAAVFVEKIDGDYYSVVGLPLSRCSRVLRDFGIVPKQKFYTNYNICRSQNRKPEVRDGCFYCKKHTNKKKTPYGSFAFILFYSALCD